jgi:hypothetical protein
MTCSELRKAKRLALGARTSSDNMTQVFATYLEQAHPAAISWLYEIGVL